MEHEIVCDGNKIESAIELVSTFPELFSSIKEKLGIILTALNEAAEIEKEMNSVTFHRLGFEVYKLVARGLPLAEALRRVAEGEGCSLQFAIAAYRWRFKHMRHHQQYMANLCVKMLIEAGYKRISAIKIAQKIGLNTICIAEEPEDVADGYFNETVAYDKIKPPKPVFNRWDNKITCGVLRTTPRKRRSSKDTK